jgi:phosphoglycerate dehydrogenase-like enzyme
LNTVDKVAVCSRSFSRNPILRAELLSRYAHVTFNESGKQLEKNELILFLRGHSKAITALEKIDDGILTDLPELNVIGKYGVGLDMIDLDAMRRHGKRLGWTSGVNKRSVAELALAYAIALLHQVVQANRQILSGEWQQLLGNQLTGKTVGIIGCGNVGQDFIRLLQPFDCKILVNDIKYNHRFNKEFKVELVTKEDLLSRANVVSLHVPLDDSTKNMLCADRLALMKPSSVLINLARGGLVDESALKIMLMEKRLAAAAFDVFSQEPPEDRDLLTLPNFLATPHIGGSAEEAILAMGYAAINGLEENAIP